MGKRLGPHLSLRRDWRYYLKHPTAITQEVRHIYYEFHSIIHRGLYGWSEHDLWNFDRYLAEMLPEVVRKYKTTDSFSHTWPGLANLGVATFEEEAFVGQEGGLTSEEYEKRENMAEDIWDSILETIAVGFEEYIKHSDFDGYDEFHGDKAGYHKMLSEIWSDPDNAAINYGNSVSIPFDHYEQKYGIVFDRDGWDELQSKRLEKFQEGMALLTEWFPYLND